jgi:hypothetical protein
VKNDLDGTENNTVDIKSNLHLDSSLLTTRRFVLVLALAFKKV